MTQDRRDHASRAEANRLVIEGLITGQYRWNLLHEGAVKRILRRLAIRGLVRATADGWVPLPPLQSPAPIIPVDPDIGDARPGS